MPELIRRKPSRRRRFLEELARGWSVSKAATAAGVSRAQIYRWRTEDLQFANDWDEAYEIGSDVIEDAAYQRAVVGIETTIVTKDGKEITKTEYSDRLLELLLKARKPKRYAKPEIQISASANLTPLTFEQVRQKYRDLGVDVDQMPILLETDDDAMR